MKAYVIINEQHILLEEQKRILENNFSAVEYIKVPANGWTLAEMKEKITEIHYKASSAEVVKFKDRDMVHYPAAKANNSVVFVSPIPYMIKQLSKKSVFWTEAGECELYKVFVFHNDRREKQEINGKIIYTVAQTGWQLV